MPRGRHDRIRAVTFDAGGTLLRPYPSVGVVYREVALAHGIDHPAEWIDRRFAAAFAHVSKNASELDPEARERDFWWRVVLRTFAVEDASGPIAERIHTMFSELWEAFAHGSRWRLFPSARPTLETLRAAGFKLAVISNWDRRLHTVLNETGMTAHFDAVIISCEAGSEKPDRGIFRAAEAALGLSAKQCLHVGDSQKHDIDGALAAGWKAILIRHGDEHPNDARIGDLNELVARLT